MPTGFGPKRIRIERTERTLSFSALEHFCGVRSNCRVLSVDAQVATDFFMAIKLLAVTLLTTIPSEVW